MLARATALVPLLCRYAECHICELSMTFRVHNSTFLRCTNAQSVKYVKGINTNRHS